VSARARKHASRILPSITTWACLDWWAKCLSRNVLRASRAWDSPQPVQCTQLDPIGLAGGLNSYGFAAGDPVNFGDPFGLAPDLLILGDQLQTEIAELRKNNKKADSAFAALENSSELSVIEDGDATGCAICQYGAGNSFDALDQASMTTFAGVADHIRKTAPGVRGYAYVNRDAAAREGQTAASAAWHEAGHLWGIPTTGSLTVHPRGHGPTSPQVCPSQVRGIPGWYCQ
jgi:hypothetical protein